MDYFPFTYITEQTFTVLDYMSNTTDIQRCKKLGLVTLREHLGSHPVFS
jgi:hypothetical protein